MAGDYCLILTKMARIKGWKKVWEGSRIRYDNRYGNSVVIQKNDNKYEVVIFYDNVNFVLESFKTKMKALKYAVCWMKEHLS